MIRKYILIFAFLVSPFLLPAPDLPPGGDAFTMLASMRKDVVSKDKADYHKKYSRFKQSLARLESRNNWLEYNRYGFIGKYQFGKSALEATGYSQVDSKEFRANPHIFPESEQEKAMDILLKLNESSLSDLFDRYVGFYVNDSIRITRAGILAAAHLAGAANVRQYLESFGTHEMRDRMGTSVSDYLYRFSR
jgi:hypothetical protein